MLTYFRRGSRNAAESRDGGNDQESGRADEEKGRTYFQGEDKTERDKADDERERREDPAGKSAFSMELGGKECSCGGGDEKRGKCEHGCEAERVGKRERRNAGKRNQDHAEDERKGGADQHGREKARFLFLRTARMKMLFHKKITSVISVRFRFHLMLCGGNL